MIVAATGHRPDKLGGYGDQASTNLVALAVDAINDLANNCDPRDFVISGMALGWDMAVAEAACIWGVPFHAYVPFEGQESRWPIKSQRLWKRLIDRAAKVVVCSGGGYAPWKMQERNKRMVDDADLILALWNGSDGGTANCVNYAQQRGKPIKNVWSHYERVRREARQIDPT